MDGKWAGQAAPPARPVAAVPRRQRGHAGQRGAGRILSRQAISSTQRMPASLPTPTPLAATARRVAGRSLALLLVPALAMTLTEAVRWGPGDFVAAGAPAHVVVFQVRAARLAIPWPQWRQHRHPLAQPVAGMARRHRGLEMQAVGACRGPAMGKDHQGKRPAAGGAIEVGQHLYRGPVDHQRQAQQLGLGGTRGLGHGGRCGFRGFDGLNGLHGQWQKGCQHAGPGWQPKPPGQGAHQFVLGLSSAGQSRM